MRAFLTLALLLPLPLFGSNISAVGGWSTTLTSANLVGGAGTDMTPTVSSSSSATVIAVSNTLTSVIYHVYANVTNSTWPPGVVLYVKRTSDGTSLLGLSTITGGTSYQALGSTNIEIFEGLLDRSGINLQFELVGLSVTTVPPNTYSGTVTFTIGP